ncbi:molybdopterin synthase, sulfur carrier subunit [Campylobacter blaseri]|uniref:Molybdopterin synthase sulfur carrier subunit n=1 Tax=Campylobacter blaseri TaxID=2042961 RepID=A0A2P8R476_9BACT|nr:MoaD/ThiS family protein [Campylobacter blaseri]PSM53296.1 molybdopterin synthase sulfur carrier subunit [Campylobacter blaseri]PSM54762.1 molybdopterin synthase sulfur carrier subunit [Campylobacter blaseri]QKF86755.1 molybdopterin synthase, sulfur carrier subunit [Campylobacter blaseri]
MVKIEFLGPIGKESIKLEASSLSDVKEILNKDTSLKEWLEICAVAINDTIVSDTNTTLKDGDKISLLPPVCGG